MPVPRTVRVTRYVTPLREGGSLPGWPADRNRARDPFPLVRRHVLLPLADALDQVDADVVRATDAGPAETIVGLIPDSWLPGDPPGSADGADRKAYVRYLTDRLAAPRAFVEEARRAR